MPNSPAPAARGFDSASVLAQVRSATRSTHDALDALLPLGLKNLHDYRRYLGALLPLAEWLALGHRRDWSGRDNEWHDPDRLACLRADCAALDIVTTPTTAAAAPTRAHWLGGCYVIEGSALGARLLSRHAAGLAEDHADVRGARRFLCHITSDPPRWGRFVHLLDALPDGDARAATSGARDGFAIVHSRLAQGAPAA